MTKPDDSSRVGRMAKLIQSCRTQHEKIGELLEELDDLAGGGAGIGPKIKHLEDQFDRLWGARYAQGATGQYIWRYLQDRPQMKKLIRVLGVEETNRRMETYLRASEPFFVNGRHSFGIFVASINSLATRQPVTLADLDLEPGPVGCQHTPRCADDVAHTKRKVAESRSWRQ